MFDAVFIDADNTLFDFDRTQAKAMGNSLAYFSLPCTDQDLAQYERINEVCWQDYHEGRLRNEDINLRRWSEWLRYTGKEKDVDSSALAHHYADQLTKQCEVEEGANELVEFLTDKLPVHVITNGFPSTQKHRWHKAGWASKLQGITVSAVVGVQKPDAKIFHLAMKSVGVDDVSRCLMIGDNLEADVLGPQLIGMKACWYQRHGMLNQTSIVPDFTVQRLNEIHALF